MHNNIQFLCFSLHNSQCLRLFFLLLFSFAMDIVYDRKKSHNPFPFFLLSFPSTHPLLLPSVRVFACGKFNHIFHIRFCLKFLTYRDLNVCINLQLTYNGSMNKMKATRIKKIFYAHHCSIFILISI